MERENKIEITDELLVKYITGDASPDEAIALSDWLSVAENQKQFDALESTWLQSSQIGRPSFNKTAAWGTISESINQHQPQGKTRSIPQPILKTILRIAAALLVIGLIGVTVYKIGNKPEVHQLAVITTTDSKELALPDKSIVTLHRNTEIDYPENFEGNTREIKLTKGEAFFKVTHDDQKPFIVHTPNGNIRVVGTEFDVITRNSVTEVSVRDGKVMVYDGSDTVLLTAGHSATIESGLPKIVSKDMSDVNVWGYATRRLVFDNTPLRDAIESIEKAYPNTVRFSNKNIENCQVTATFDNDSVDKIVNLVADILNLTVTKNGETFTLEGQGCQ